MNARWIRPFAVCAAAYALAAAPAHAQHKSSSMHEAMSKSMSEMQSMQMTGDADKDFATMMKHHHQSGIEMARIQLREGKDPELKKQAQKIVDSQKKEIADLERWMQKSQSGAAGSASPRAASPAGKSESGQSGHHAGK